ncbi:hypothetical protein Tco_1162774 [Tanacetum coccineum]
MYKEYLAEFWYSSKTLENTKVFFSTRIGGIYGKVGVNTFMNDIGTHYLPHSSEYVAPSSFDIVRPRFETIRYREVVPTKGTLKKSLLPPIWSLANGINIDYASIFWEDIIIKLNKKHREKFASGCDVSTDSIAKADIGLSSPSDFIPQQQARLQGASSIARQVEEKEASSTINLEDLAKLVSNVQPSFKDLDSPEDDPVIVVDDSNEDEEDEVHTTTNVETEDTSISKSSSPRSSQIQELTNQLNKLLVKSLQTEFSKILSAYDFSSSLPTELKDLPSKFNELTEEVKGLNKQVHELEIELPGDLKEIPTKLEDFTKTITILTS